MACNEQQNKLITLIALPETVNSNMGRDSGPLITLNIVSQMMLHVVLASFGMELLK
jgi:hypothetical protein